MPAILLRAIKPKRQKLLDPARVRAELQDVMNELKDDILADFEKTTDGWQTQVDFSARFYAGDNLRITVSPGGPGAEIWGYVNSGTRPHLIRAHGRTLAFEVGGETVFTPVVHHPGTKARNFDEMIAAKHRPAFRALAENGLRRALR